MALSEKFSAKQVLPLRAPILMNGAEAEVVRAVRRQGKISRTEISNITGWSKAKTSQEIRSLVDKGYLVEVGEGMSQGGRRPGLLQINDQLGYLVGLDIGATSVDMVLTNVGGKVFQRCSDHNQILGIGVGVPGPVDFTRGVLVAPPLMPDWENFSICDFFQHTFPTAYVVVDNDVNIKALAEQRAGDGIDVDHFIFIHIGTGIGSGIVSNGKIHRGSQGCAGDIGHICVDKQGPICRCGNTGCLEAMAAGPAITEKAILAARNGSSPLLNQMLEANGGVLRPEDLNAACREGDQVALEIIRASGQMIGDVLAGLVNFFNPSHIFIGGGIANFGNHLLVSIRRAVLRRSLPLATTHLAINFSRMGSEAGVTGAVALAREYLFLVGDQPFQTV
jgi:glucokinase-like ROK family protein